MQKDFFENPAEVAGTETMPSENGQVSHEFINKAKDGLEIVRQPADQVEDKPQANPDSETPEAAEPVGGDAEVVDEPQDNSEPTAQEAAEPVGFVTSNGNIDVAVTPAPSKFINNLDETHILAKQVSTAFGLNDDSPKSNDETSVDEICNVVQSFITKVGVIGFFVSLKLSQDLGIKICFIKGNRQISISQIEKLKKDLREKKSSKFENPMKVVFIRSILEKNEKLSDSQKIHVFDINGVEITLDNPEVDKCVAILDGQHRYTVCQLDKNIDVNMEIVPCPANVIGSISTLNTVSRNWNNEDRKASNLALGIYNDTGLFEKSKLVQDYLGASPKYADYLLTFKKEAFSKVDLVKGVDNSTYTPEKGERGVAILGALLHRFPDNVKEIRQIQLVDAIKYAYDMAGEKNHPTFSRDIVCCLVGLADTQVAGIVKTIQSKDYGTLNVVLKEAYESFRDTHLNVIDKFWEDAKNKIFTALDSAQNEAELKAQTKRLKIGTTAEILKNQANLVRIKAAKKTARKSEAKPATEEVAADADTSVNSENKAQ